MLSQKHEKSEIENLRAFWKLGQGNCKVRECSDFKIVSFILDDAMGAL